VKACFDGFNITPNRNNIFVQHRQRDGELLISFYLKSVKFISKHLELTLLLLSGYSKLTYFHLIHQCQFGAKVLGKCRRFHLVSFCDNDVWNSKHPSPDGDDGLAKVRA
jgi:hypothetical protein